MAYYRYGEEDYKALLSRSRYSVEISKVLFDRVTLSHNELCEAIDVKKNNLSNVVKKLAPFEILFVRRIGKNVYYSLSPKGFEFYKYFKAQEEMANRPQGQDNQQNNNEQIVVNPNIIFNR